VLDAVPPPVATRRRELRRAIAGLAVPMTVAQGLSVVAPIVVVALMGRMGDEALYVRSLFMPLASLFTAVQMAFDISNQTLTAVKVGRGERSEVSGTALSMARLWAGVGLVLAAVLIVVTPLLSDLLHVRSDSRADFAAFVGWVSLANVALAWPVLCASCLRAAGRARSAAAVTLTTIAVEVGGVASFGVGVGVGVLSVPACTVAGAVIAGSLGTVLVRHHGLTGGHRPWAWRPAALREVLRTGVPVSVFYVVMFGMNLALVWILTPYGAVVISGFSIVGTVQTMVFMPGTVLGSAAAIVMNRRYGQDPRTRRAPVFRVALETAVALFAVLTLALWLGRHVIGHVTSGNPRIAAETAHILGIIGPTYLLLGLVLASIAVLEQTGGGFVAVGLIAFYVCGTVVTGAVATAATHDPDGLYYAIAGMNVTGLTVVAIAVAYVRRLDRRAVEPRALKPEGEVG